MNDQNSPPIVRVPKQKRSREKFSAMMKAAEKLFAVQGIQETSIQQIVSEAGTSVGAFYQRFENKDALVYNIFLMVENELTPDEGELIPKSGQSLETTLENIVKPIAKMYRSHKGVFLAMMMEARRNPHIHQYVKEAHLRARARFEKIIRHHKDEIQHRNIKAATEMTLRLMTSYLDGYLLWGEDPDIEKRLSYKVSDKEIIKILALYLRGK